MLLPARALGAVKVMAAGVRLLLAMAVRLLLAEGERLVRALQAAGRRVPMGPVPPLQITRAQLELPTELTEEA